VSSLNLCRPYSDARLERRRGRRPQYLIEEQDDLQQNSGTRTSADKMRCQRNAMTRFAIRNATRVAAKKPAVRLVLAAEQRGSNPSGSPTPMTVRSWREAGCS
jgi:hypothetical protein